MQNVKITKSAKVSKVCLSFHYSYNLTAKQFRMRIILFINISMIKVILNRNLRTILIIG